MTIQDLERQILIDIAAARARGMTIVQASFGNDETQCCALTAFEGCQWADLEQAKQHYGMSGYEAWEFIKGFDAAFPVQNQSEFYRLGRRIQEQVGPTRVGLAATILAHLE